MNINNKLTTFAQQELVLAHSDIEREKITASLTHLEKKLKDRFGNDIKEFIRFGSFTRNTILPRQYDPESDIDLMIIFNSHNGLKTPGTYRTNLHDFVDKAYPNSFSQKDFPAVKLELYHIKFDLVPAYCEDSRFLGTRYYIPDKNNSWRLTVPNDINKPLSDKNQSYGNNIVRNVIRLCKCWNAGAGYPFESYGLEKWILDRFFFMGDNLYDKFLSVLRDRAGNMPAVSQALNSIEKYKDVWLGQPNEQKQFEWLQRLLPGL